MVKKFPPIEVPVSSLEQLLSRPQLLTPSEVCDVLRKSWKTLKRIMSRGEISYVRDRGGYRFRPVDVALYINRRMVRAKAA